MITLIKKGNVFTPKSIGVKDILIVNNKIVRIEDDIKSFDLIDNEFDANNMIITPGLIDQHIHLIGAGGKDGYSSMTPEVNISDLIKCGSTTSVGLLGTDGTARNIRTLYSKVKSIEQAGLSAYMFSGYYGVDSVTITDSLQADMIFIDNVIGCKIAISDIRSSYPTALDLLRKLRDVRVGGMISNKKGILHVHLGSLDTKMDLLFDLVRKYKFPIENISPTHVGRTKELFDQAIDFANLGGIIDITTGASKFIEPYKAVLYALEKGVSIDKISFSSDGHAGLTKFDKNGKAVGVMKAPIDKNLEQVISLIKKGGLDIESAFKLITKNPANNLGLKNKGNIYLDADADLCCFDKNFRLQDVFANGRLVMNKSEVLLNEKFEI